MAAATVSKRAVCFIIASNPLGRTELMNEQPDCSEAQMWQSRDSYKQLNRFQKKFLKNSCQKHLPDPIKLGKTRALYQCRLSSVGRAVDL